MFRWYDTDSKKLVYNLDWWPNELMSLGRSYWEDQIDYTSRNGLTRLPDITPSNLNIFAAIFDATLGDIYWIANHHEEVYNTFFISKSNGKKRKIDAPEYRLKDIQQWILANILYRIPCSKYAKAYVPGVNVKENSKYHRKRKIVLTMDVQDFFSSIKENHVYNIFHQVCGYEPSVAVLLTKLCTCNGILPQGAPSSAYLSNLVLKRFDEAVGEYCAKQFIYFTRYADDMTFSGDFDIAELLRFVDRELTYIGLKRHPEKLRVMRQHDCQKTTGIVVNSKQQVPREYRMKIRQEIYFIKTYGLDSHVERIGADKSHYLQSLLGRIDYVLSINPKDSKMREYRRYIEALKTLESYK